MGGGREHTGLDPSPSMDRAGSSQELVCQELVVYRVREPEASDHEGGISRGSGFRFG